MSGIILLEQQKGTKAMKMNIIFFDTILHRTARYNGFPVIDPCKGEVRYLLSTTAHNGSVEIFYDNDCIHVVPHIPYIKDEKVINEIILGENVINDIMRDVDKELAKILNELHKYYMNF